MAMALVYIDGRLMQVPVPAWPPFYNPGDRISSDHWPDQVLTVQNVEFKGGQVFLHLITGVTS